MIATVPVSADPIAEQLEPPRPKIAARSRIHRIIREHRSQRDALRAYDGSPLIAENISRASRKTALVDARRKAIRAEAAGVRGRRMDLIALLRNRDAQGRPLWTVADPTKRIGSINGMADRSGTVFVASRHCAHPLRTGRPCQGGRSFIPDGIPPLPAAARQIVTDPAVRKRAHWVGVLYQPQSWTEVDPDPAVVVEWTDRPGEYYCLAVWGGDRAQIEEFIH